VAAIAGHDDRLLAEIAPLGVANCLARAADFDDEALFIHVLPVNGKAGLHAENLIRIAPCRRRARGAQRAPDLGGLAVRTKDVEPPYTEHAVRTVCERPQDRTGLRTGQMHLGRVVRGVTQLDLFADEMAVQMFEDGTTHARSRIDPQAISFGRAKNKDMGHNFRFGSRQERFATCARFQRLDVIGRQVVQERHGVRAAHLDLAVVRAVEQCSVRAGTLVLGDGPCEVERHQPAGVVCKDGTGRGGGVVKWTPLSHGLSFELGK
jgi:hypothetical protein